MAFNNRYQPEVWADLVFANPQVEYDLRQYAQGKLFDNILLYGPYGSAKSITAEVLAATSYGKRLSDAILDVTKIHHDINARLQAFANATHHGLYALANNTNRVYAIMNEVDKYTTRQQLHLRGIVDEQVIGRFIFTTNNLENVDPGLVDRCDCYELEIPPPDVLLARAQAICTAEGVQITSTELEDMIKEVNGSLRRTMQALEKLVQEVKA